MMTNDIQDDSTIVQLTDVIKAYSSGDAINGVSFVIPRGQIIGLLGLNGSGKTTTMKMISGLVRPTYGTIRVGGKIPRQGRHHVAFLGDRYGFPSWMICRDVERMMETFYKDFNKEMFRHFALELNFPSDRPLGHLSRGELQKVKLAVTMSRKTDLYLLDEPLAGIDLIARKHILTGLMKHWNRSSTVLVATHEIKDLEPYLNRGIFLKRGKMVADIDRDPNKSFSDRFIELMEEN